MTSSTQENKADITFEITFQKNIWKINWVLFNAFLLLLFSSIFYGAAQGKKLEAVAPVLIVWVIWLMRIARGPRKIVISEKHVSFDGESIKWSDICRVDFTLPRRDLSSQAIELSLVGHDEKLIIHPRLYKDNTKLRMLFEEIAINKGIKGIVEERGL